MNGLKKDYFNWICSCLKKSFPEIIYHVPELKALFDKPFIYNIPFDGNRYEDGVSLRYKYGDEIGIDDRIISYQLDQDSCSVLEMMVALSTKEAIYMDNGSTDSTGFWFKQMLISLGLFHSENEYLDRKYVDDILETFLNRRYRYDGSGGLFTLSEQTIAQLSHKGMDIRDLEIWQQMNAYINQIPY